MRNFQHKGGVKNIMQSVPVLVILFVVLLFFAWGVIRFLIKMNNTSRNREIAENKVIELSKQRDQLSGDIESLKTDRGLEENIREKFGLAKEGEGVIVIVDDKNAVEAEVKKENWLTLFFKNWFK
jgi:cell division protein FtsB